MIDNRSDPQAVQMVQIPGPRLKLGAKPRGFARGVCCRLELTGA